MILQIAAPALGLLAAAVLPIVIHIVHRRRSRLVAWGAMRFLRVVLERERTRLRLENLLLLTLRVLFLLAIAGALMRPQLRTRAEGLGDQIPRAAPTAAVLLIDDSLASAAPAEAPAITGMRALAHAYLDTLASGDEVSILTGSTLGEPAADPLIDLPSAHQALDRIVPSAGAGDGPALIAAGLEQLRRHLNPEAELVLITPGAGGCLAAADPARWQEVASQLALPTAAGDDAVGTRTRPHLILLHPPAPTTALQNAAVVALHLDASLVPAGTPVQVHARIALRGTHRVEAVLARLALDGRTVAERACALSPPAEQQIDFTLPSPPAGSHVLEVALTGARDQLPIDDRRAVALVVAASIPVLLVEGEPGTGLRGSLGLFAAALAPTGSEAFQPRRIGLAGLTDTALSEARVVVLGDCPLLDAGSIARLERFCAGGGGILVAAGPHLLGEEASRFAWRGGDGFLPARLGPPRTLPAALGARLLPTGRPAYATLARAGAMALADAGIRQLHAVEEVPPDAEPLLTTSAGDLLAVARARGRGRVVLLATGLDGEDAALPLTPGFVPLVRALVMDLAGELRPPRDLRIGERLAWEVPPGVARETVHATAPDGQVLPLLPGTWEGSPALLSAPVLQPGTATVFTGETVAARYAVALDPQASTLQPLTDATISACLPGVPRHEVARPLQVAELFGATGDRTHELWLPLGVAALVLLAAESGWAWVLRRRSRGP